MPSFRSPRASWMERVHFPLAFGYCAKFRSMAPRFLNPFGLSYHFTPRASRYSYTFFFWHTENIADPAEQVQRARAFNLPESVEPFDMIASSVATGPNLGIMDPLGIVINKHKAGSHACSHSIDGKSDRLPGMRLFTLAVKRWIDCGGHRADRERRIEEVRDAREGGGRISEEVGVAEIKRIDVRLEIEPVGEAGELAEVNGAERGRIGRLAGTQLRDHGFLRGKDLVDVALDQQYSVSVGARQVRQLLGDYFNGLAASFAEPG